ncbi:MAG: trimethylamine methyltransferase family protein [Desulfobacterales bacterium]|nr:trimethylamine methyltransferase family protein [Desulfobacterales bacterium]
MTKNEIYTKMSEAIVAGDRQAARALAEEAVRSGFDLLEVVEQGYVPGIQRVGALWEQGEYFLPELITSAEAMKSAMAVLDPELNRWKGVNRAGRPGGHRDRRGRHPRHRQEPGRLHAPGRRLRGLRPGRRRQAGAVHRGRRRGRGRPDLPVGPADHDHDQPAAVPRASSRSGVCGTSTRSSSAGLRPAGSGRRRSARTASPRTPSPPSRLAKAGRAGLTADLGERETKMFEAKRPKLELLEKAFVERIVDEGLTLLEDPGVLVENRRGPAPARRGRGQRWMPPPSGPGSGRKPGREVPGLDPGLGHALRPAAARRPSSSEATRSISTPGSAAVNLLDHATQAERKASTADVVDFIQARRDPRPFPLPEHRSSSPSDVPAGASDALPALSRPGPVREAVHHRDLPGRGLPGHERPSGRRPRRRGGAAAQAPGRFRRVPLPPLKWSHLTAQSLMDAARAGLPSELISVGMTGATSPVTLAGTLVQHVAENLAGLVICQLAGPGAPVIFGGSPSSFDMRQGHDAPGRHGRHDDRRRGGPDRQVPETARPCLHGSQRRQGQRPPGRVRDGPGRRDRGPGRRQRHLRGRHARLRELAVPGEARHRRRDLRHGLPPAGRDRAAGRAHRPGRLRGIPRRGCPSWPIRTRSGGTGRSTSCPGWPTAIPTKPGWRPAGPPSSTRPTPMSGAGSRPSAAPPPRRRRPPGPRRGHGRLRRPRLGPRRGAAEGLGPRRRRRADRAPGSVQVPDLAVFGVLHRPAPLLTDPLGELRGHVRIPVGDEETPGRALEAVQPAVQSPAVGMGREAVDLGHAGPDRQGLPEDADLRAPSRIWRPRVSRAW